ncbi:MAG: Lipid A biosynthesis lauroyl acyltransferase [Ignavibacteriae bacterium]|nr:MAG: Lipid A biosynthesis lauroyl acyltransferase [Ignavibacteriota bacterium]
MKNYLEYFLVLLLINFVSLFPLNPARRIGIFLSNISYIFLFKRRKITIENLANSFPEKSIKEIKIIAKKVFQNIGITFIEFALFPKLNKKITDLVKYRNLDLMFEKCKLGKGLIMLSGHFGNWELNAFSTGYISGYPLTIIVKTQSNKLVDKLINKHRTLLGNKVVPMQNSVREILNVLNTGGVVAMLADQSAPKESVFINFFNREVATFQGPAVFALKTKAPLLMGFIIRNEDFTYEVILEEIQTNDLDDYNEQNVKILTQRHTALLEEYIRKYPHLWMWTHRRWKNVKVKQSTS